MSIYTVEYTYTDDDAGRDQYRPEHREYLGSLEGLLLSGPYRDLPAGALLVFRADDEQAVVALLDQDPFHRQGLIAERTIREYEPVLGTETSRFAG